MATLTREELHGVIHDVSTLMSAEKPGVPRSSRGGRANSKEFAHFEQSGWGASSSPIGGDDVWVLPLTRQREPFPNRRLRADQLYNSAPETPPRRVQYAALFNRSVRCVPGIGGSGACADQAVAR